MINIDRIKNIKNMPENTEFRCPVCGNVFDKDLALYYDGLACCADNGQMVELELNN